MTRRGSEGPEASLRKEGTLRQKGRQMDRKCKEEEEGKKENETGGDGEKELQHDRGRATERKPTLDYSLP